ncbi:MAG: ferritin [bacterium]
MINKTVENAINAQIKHELDSAYLYLAMSAHCESINLNGFAHWLRSQYEEELSHAMRLFDFLNERGGRVILQSIDQPPADFRSPLEMFKQVLEHEKKVTGLIHQLYELAVKENDYPTQVELQWFITEQVEEEASVGNIVEQLKLAGEHGTALLMMDKHLAKRGAGQ